MSDKTVTVPQWVLDKLKPVKSATYSTHYNIKGDIENLKKETIGDPYYDAASTIYNNAINDVLKLLENNK